VHAVLESLTRHLPDVRPALLNGQASAQEEAAILEGSNLPGAVPSLLGLLPAIQPLFQDRPAAINYSPAAVVGLLSGTRNGSRCMDQRDLPFACDRQSDASEVSSPVNIAVLTPGRLVHHLRRLGSHWLKHLKFLVCTCCAHYCCGCSSSSRWYHASTLVSVNSQASVSDFWGKQIHQTWAHIPMKYLKCANTYTS
jgi:hypothetical protein